MRHISTLLTLLAVLFVGSVPAVALPFLPGNFPETARAFESAPSVQAAADKLAASTANSVTPGINPVVNPESRFQGLRRRLKKLTMNAFDFAEYRRLFFGFPFWVALVVTLALERIIPVQPNRKLFSVRFAHDFMWFLYEPILHALVIGTYVAFLIKIYKTYFSHLTFTGLAARPGWIRFTVALLVLDLGYWLQHFLNHKVPFLWKLHSVHHSQPELNFFTDFRYHPLEYIVRHTFITIPFLFLSVTPPAVVGFAVIKEWYSRFYHGNIRTNLGPLKYILVTPQSHRIHHSLEVRHQDLNFGAIFSFWDFLFRKQYRGFDEYPATGIEEKSFPHEQEISLKSLFLTPWLQMLHPFSAHSIPSPVSPDRTVERIEPLAEVCSE